jgi:Fe-S cluster assembly protein SufB/Fe-S cluster assembly protein SufD
MTTDAEASQPTDHAAAGSGPAADAATGEAAAQQAADPEVRAARAAARAAAAAASRATRRAPADLPLAFATEESVRARAASAGEPDWLLGDRLAGLARFAELPLEVNRLYTLYADMRGADLEAVAPYLDGPALAAAGADDPAHLPDGADGVIEVRGGSIPIAALSPAARAAGVTLEPLDALVARDPARARELLDAGADLPGDDKLAQLARALWTTGVHVDVPAGVALDGPIVLRFAGGVPGRAVLARTLVALGDGATASIVEEIVPAGPEIGCAAGESVPQSLIHGTTEVRIGADATLTFASLQDLGPGAVAFAVRRSELGPRATLRWALAQVGARISRTRVDNLLAGDGASVEQVEIVFGSDDQLFDLTSYTRHVGRDTTADLLSKAAMLDHSRSYIKGLTTIDNPARGTDSFLGEFGMLLTKGSRSVTIPSLEIDQPDCRRVGHASSVGPIDPLQMFYLESRGIDPADARKFIVLGFLEPVVARVPLATEQDRLRAILEAKWDASTASADAVVGDPESSAVGDAGALAMGDAGASVVGDADAAGVGDPGPSIGLGAG